MPRVLLLLAALLAGLAPCAIAQDQRTPRAVIDEIYSYYSDGTVGIWPTDPRIRPLFTNRLMTLLDADDAVAEREGIGRLSFDPFVNAQDFAIEDLALSLSESSGDTARVEVTFENFGAPTRLVYWLEQQGDGLWRIDDIEAPDGPYPWRLGNLLSED